MATYVTGNTITVDAVTSANAAVSGVQVGDLIAVCVGNTSGAVPSSVTSSLDGAFTQEASYSNNFRVLIYRLPAATAGTHTITVTYAAADDIQAFIDVFRGLATTGLPDAETTGTSGSGATTIQHGTLAISAAGVILTLARIGGGASVFTPASGFTLDNMVDRMIRQYRLMAASGTPTNSFTADGAVDYDGIAVAYINGATSRKVIIGPKP